MMLEIVVDMDLVRIENQLVRRPSFVSRGQWLNQWEEMIAAIESDDDPVVVPPKDYKR